MQQTESNLCTHMDRAVATWFDMFTKSGACSFDSFDRIEAAVIKCRNNDDRNVAGRRLAAFKQDKCRLVHPVKCKPYQLVSNVMNAFDLRGCGDMGQRIHKMDERGVAIHALLYFCRFAMNGGALYIENVRSVFVVAMFIAHKYHIGDDNQSDFRPNYQLFADEFIQCGGNGRTGLSAAEWQFLVTIDHQLWLPSDMLDAMGRDLDRLEKLSKSAQDEGKLFSAELEAISFTITKPCFTC